MGRLIIDGNSVYEIDDECQQEQNHKVLEKPVSDKAKKDDGKKNIPKQNMKKPFKI